MHIIKKKGHTEHFEIKKVELSIYKAGLNAALTKEEATRLTKKMVKSLKQWIKNKKNITSNQLSMTITKLLKKEDDNAAFMYETHKDIN